MCITYLQYIQWIILSLVENAIDLKRVKLCCVFFSRGESTTEGNQKLKAILDLEDATIGDSGITERALDYENK